MLVRLFAENFGPFKDGFDLSLEALDLPAEGDRGYFEVPIEGEAKPLKLLRLAAIYGANASGKSTVVKAANALRNLAVYSGPRYAKGKPIDVYEPFALDPATREAPCVLGAEVVMDRRVFEYRVAFTRHEIAEEQITELREDGDRVWLRREGQAIEVQKEYLALTLDPSSYTRPNATALSMAVQNNQAPLEPLQDALDLSLRAVSSNTDMILPYSMRLLHRDEAFRTWAMRYLIGRADLGITDVRTEEKDIPEELAQQMQLFGASATGSYDPSQGKMFRARFTHRGAEDDGEIDWTDESQGTIKLLALAGPWYDVLHNGMTVFVDELSASLHEDMLVALLEAFNASSDDKPTQLVFTTHDTTPLEGALRRDQVFFTRKGPDGAAEMYPLAEFGDRKEHNVRKRYLQGRYGGVPSGVDFGGLFGDGDA